MTDKPKAMRPRKRWKRVVKWTLGTIFVALILWGFVAYWTSTNDCDRNAANPANPMKAVVHCDYGITNLKLQEIEKPTPADDQVLVRVRAASLNPLDGHFVRGMWLARLMDGGLRKPKDTRLGVDYAGTVEAVGKNVTQFKPGDEVFGGRTGSLAQYVCARADRAIALKPANMTFEQAGSVAVAAITALQGLREKGHIQAGQKVLINGASGGVGTFAVQIAKSLGAEVTGVCSTRNLDLVRSIGADHVIDYTKEDFTKGNQRYDVIFDNVQNHTFSERRRVLTSNGICVLAGLGGAGWHENTWKHLVRSFTTPLMSKFTSQKFSFYISQLNHNDLALLGDLMLSGKVTPVIDRTYKSLGEVQDALQYLEQGHARGKVVITVE
ncbi:MAG: L-threonine 3-dehydrogenase [Candidatus Udaeobacter sp.]|jgi:NADPH:quinone reductase-like Zn-dependent oxidoreductase|nr:MAG: L-threonine 3-dehydrogenase [Candidatus Udaeobacter sp.]